MPKRPWNRVNLPVYSISSKDGMGNFNMHIITYASQISMQPKRFVCGIFEGTKTLELVLKQPTFVLQLLSDQQYRLVDLLGKKSGNNIDKIARLHKRQLLTDWNGFPILKDALAVMLLDASEMNANKFLEKGDHRIFLCNVIDYANLNDGNTLTLDVLRQHKLIRI
jgi:flavin reductase (DIM6/NTAB) family NADH-FMN oxidoreductase RutF